MLHKWWVNRGGGGGGWCWRYLEHKPLGVLQQKLVLDPRHLLHGVQGLLARRELVVVAAQLLAQQLPGACVDGLRVLLRDAHLLRHVHARLRQECGLRKRRQERGQVDMRVGTKVSVCVRGGKEGGAPASR